MNRRDTIGFGTALGLGALLPAPAMACRLFPRSSTDRYGAYQDETQVGSQWFEFSRSSGQIVVTSELDIRYRDHAGATVSLFHRAREAWHRGWLNAFSAKTRYSDREIRIEAYSLEQGILSVESSDSDVTLQVSGYVVPSSLWHRDSRLVNRLIDLVDGRVKLVQVYYAGKDLLPHDGGAIVATHYRVRGEINRDAWYSNNCQLLRTLMPLQNAKPVSLELLSAVV